MKSRIICRSYIKKKNNADIIFKKKKNLQIIVFQAMLQEFFHRVFSLNFVNCNKILDSFEVIVWDNILLNCKTANVLDLSLLCR